MIILFVFHQPGPSQLRFVVVGQGQNTAEQPTGRIAHCDGDDLVTDAGHHEQVYLPEHNEGGQHDDHGHSAVARATQGAGVDLVEAAQHIEGSHPPQQQRAVLHHFALAVEEGNDGLRENHHG